MPAPSVVLRTHREDAVDFLPHRGNLCGQEADVPHLSPTTLTVDEQRLILRATTGNVRDHTIISLALGIAFIRTADPLRIDALR
jgi:hypothetical protein